MSEPTVMTLSRWMAKGRADGWTAAGAASPATVVVVSSPVNRTGRFPQPVTVRAATASTAQHPRFTVDRRPRIRSIIAFARRRKQASDHDVNVGARVIAVRRSPGYTFTKSNEDCITLVTMLGVEGDAHLGATVRHRSRMRTDPETPNLRQVHLMHAELFDELDAAGFSVTAGQLGENVTTSGVDLLALPTGTRLHLGPVAVVEVTGLRNPCVQLDGIQPGLMA